MAIRMTTMFNAALLTALCAAAIWALLWLAGPDWSVYAPASCTATRCFCELPRSGSLIVQPANSWSSLGFTFAGFLMILNARATRMGIDLSAGRGASLWANRHICRAGIGVAARDANVMGPVF